MTHRLSFSIVVLAISFAPLGCVADAFDDQEDGESDVGDNEPTAQTQEALSRRCAISRAQILASVGPRRERVIRRAFSWWDEDVPYSQKRYYEGYRTDCSGFVSMAWELSGSTRTSRLIRDDGPAFRLDSYAALKPGDALVRREDGYGHVTLFLGWNDSARTSACVIEQMNPDIDMAFGTRSTSSLRSEGYKPIRADELR